MDITSHSYKIRRSGAILQMVIDILIWLSAAFPVLYLFLFGTPYKSGFFCDDVTLSYPAKPDTVSALLLMLSGFAISVSVVVFVEVLRCIENRNQRSFRITGDICFSARWFAVYLVGFVIEQLTVQVLKHEMGVLRPNFYAVCKPTFNRSFCPGYITNYTCTGEPEQVRESRQSFPSGHASFSMYVAIYFCFYIHHRLQITFSRILKFVLQTGLVIIAMMCGLTRISDHKHHPCDVVVGFLLGIVTAVFTYMIGGKVAAHGSDSDQPKIVLRMKSCDCYFLNSHKEEQDTHFSFLTSNYLNVGYEKTPTTPLLTESSLSVCGTKSLPVTSYVRKEGV